jgi:hypothetical protein
VHSANAGILPVPQIGRRYIASNDASHKGKAIHLALGLESERSVNPRRSSIFVSYRRDDTSGEAGHLAADRRKRFGRKTIFIDIDTIAPETDFEDRINDALSACRMTFILIGKQWLNAALPDGTRRLDHERDYVRKEIATALRRPLMTVVAVLVEGAAMPSAEQLPPDIAELAKRNAAELSNKRWRYDVNQMCAIAEHEVRWFSRPA